MQSKALRFGFPLVAGILVLPTILFAQKGVSHVRVVRLSYVSGTVAVKRPASADWAKAIPNTPIQEGFSVLTSASSYAEVEFENGSTARLGEFSQLTFDQLAMDADGNKLNHLTFDKGYATFHILPEHHDDYSVKMAASILTPGGKSEFRADLEPGKARVEVFSGSVELAASQKSVKLGKDKVLEFDPGATELAVNVQQGITKDSWDKWTSARDSQAQLSLNDQAVGTHGPLYGWSDLNTYGEWGYFPGFGYGWSPYAAAGWAPYSMGMWSFYPGMGYAWIGGEPWGWLPYHYGLWNFSPGFGWFWMPGSMDMWSPSLVSWYSGPGWIGWTPLGFYGGMGPGMVTTVPLNVMQNGLPVSSQNMTRVPASAGERIKEMPFQPGAGAMLSGTRLSASAETPGAARAFTGGARAPASILMGANAANEQALQMHSSRQPLRMRMGTTLGGTYSAGGTVGVFRGDTFAGSHGMRTPGGMQEPEFSRGAGRGAPTLLPHGQQASSSPSNGGGSMAPRSGPSMNSGSSSMQSMGPSNGSGMHSAGPSAGGSSGGHH